MNLWVDNKPDSLVHKKGRAFIHAVLLFGSMIFLFCYCMFEYFLVFI